MRSRADLSRYALFSLGAASTSRLRQIVVGSSGGGQHNKEHRRSRGIVATASRADLAQEAVASKKCI